MLFPVFLFFSTAAFAGYYGSQRTTTPCIVSHAPALCLFPGSRHACCFLCVCWLCCGRPYRGRGATARRKAIEKAMDGHVQRGAETLHPAGDVCAKTGVPAVDCRAIYGKFRGGYCPAFYWQSLLDRREFRKMPGK